MNTSARSLLGLSILLLSLVSCSVLKQANEMKNFARCEFRLKNMENITLAGVDITGVDQFSDLNFSEAGNITMTAMKGKLPLFFILNIEVRNPNEKKASMNRFLWDLFIDGQLITSGKVTRDISVAPAGGITVFPVEVGVDLFDVLSGESADAVINFAMNLTGNGGVPSEVMLRAKPTIYVAMTEVDYPGWIKIRQEFISE